jgi:sorbitol-specific phosphotransferase system component IIBC
MIGKILSAVAGQSIARTVGGTAAGPVGAVLGAAVPTVLPWVARRLGPVGMVAAAVGSYVVARAIARREEAGGVDAAAKTAARPGAGRKARNVKTRPPLA